MTRMCFIGNSHLAAIKEGWERVRRDFGEFDITFFAARAKRLQGLYLDNGALVPDNDALAKYLAFTSNGLSEICLKDYDVFLVYGLGLKPIIKWQDSFYTSQFRSEAYGQSFNKCLNVKIATMIASCVSVPVFVGHEPLPSGRAGYLNYSKSDFSGSMEDMKKYVNSNYNLNFVVQPDYTVDDVARTKTEYSIGSKRLGVGVSNDFEEHPKSDCWHMNKKYGESWVLNFMELLHVI